MASFSERTSSPAAVRCAISASRRDGSTAEEEEAAGGGRAFSCMRAEARQSGESGAMDFRQHEVTVHIRKDAYEHMCVAVEKP